MRDQTGPDEGQFPPQMQIANDIRPEGFLLRFNSLLFELLFQLYHNFSVQY
ncbi:MAG: hypothetical protein ACLR0U_13550 [Enterocloster clostridioformis]